MRDHKQQHNNNCNKPYRTYVVAPFRIMEKYCYCVWLKKTNYSSSIVKRKIYFFVSRCRVLCE